MNDKRVISKVALRSSSELVEHVISRAKDSSRGWSRISSKDATKPSRREQKQKRTRERNLI